MKKNWIYFSHDKIQRLNLSLAVSMWNILENWLRNWPTTLWCTQMRARRKSVHLGMDLVYNRVFREIFKCCPKISRIIPIRSLGYRPPAQFFFSVADLLLSPHSLLIKNISKIQMATKANIWAFRVMQMRDPKCMGKIWYYIDTRTCFWIIICSAAGYFRLICYYLVKFSVIASSIIK